MSGWRWALLGFAIVLQSGLAFADSDSDQENYDLGVVAMENKDCIRAADAFDRVTGDMRRDASFMRYGARANECAGRLEKALQFYRQLDTDGAGDLILRRKIAELRYKIETQAHPGAGAAATPAPADTPAPAVNGRSAVTFRSPDADHHYEVVAVTASGGRERCSVTFLQPCTMTIPVGPATVTVSGSGSITQSLTIPAAATILTIHYDGRHGQLITGTVLTVVGVSALVYGVNRFNATQDNTPNANTNAFAGFGAFFGGAGAITGLSLILIDQVRNRGNGIRSDETAQADGPSFAGATVIPLHNGAAAGVTFTF
jgi:hypothetical protein